MNQEAVERIIQANNKMLDEMEGHDQVAHDGLPLSQTGFRKDCKRCRFAERASSQHDRLRRQVSQ